jgi:Predicted metal-binding integral membrane protein (DUF2182)
VASFLGMWIVMMIAMMLPSLVPVLRRYRQFSRWEEILARSSLLPSSNINQTVRYAPAIPGPASKSQPLICRGPSLRICGRGITTAAKTLRGWVLCPGESVFC